MRTGRKPQQLALPRAVLPGVGLSGRPTLTSPWDAERPGSTDPSLPGTQPKKHSALTPHSDSRNPPWPGPGDEQPLEGVGISEGFLEEGTAKLN